MALSDEQNAMLRLLASGEQGYGDIAALLGLSEDEVRAKVVGALAQLQAEGKPAPDIPPPIPGGAKPAAEAVPPEPEPEPAPPPAKKDAPPVEPVVAAPAAPQAPPTSPSTSGGGRTITLPTGRKAWLLGGGILAAIAAIVVVVILVSGGGGGGSTTASNEGGSTTAAETGRGEQTTPKEPTQAILEPVGGGTASGKATFGVGKLKGKRQLILAIEAKGLSPTAKGETYAISFAKSSSKVVPMAATPVKANGKIEAATYLPNQIAEYLAAEVFTQIVISKANEKQLTAAMTSSSKSGKAPSYIGEPVLEGTITGPIVGLAKREEEQKGE